MKSSEDFEYVKKIGQRIAEIRKEKGFSQRELCLEIGWDKPNLSSLEAGNRAPSILTIRRICNGLGVTMSDFFDFD